MNVPSLAVGLHERDTPELRDRIFEALRQSIAQTAYGVLSATQVRALAAIDSPRAPILSLYLQLTPDRRARNAWHAAFASLADATLKRIGDRREHEALKDELDRIESALRDELSVSGRGVAFFTCRPLDLWRQISVPAALPDGLYLDSRPYVRPLVRTLDEHDRFVLALLSQEHSRFFFSQIGRIEEVFEVKDERLPRKLADRVAHSRGDVLVPEPVVHEVHILAHVATAVLAQLEARHLLLSGAPELRSAFAHSLPKDVQQRIGGEFSVEIRARPAEVAAAAQSAQTAIEEREEVKTLTRMIEAGPAGSAWGVGPTLDALRVGRVMILAVDDLFAEPGARCRNCGELLEAIPPSCPVCGSNAVEAVADVVELALEKALEQRAALELVRSLPARQLMSGRGPMAALFR